MMTPRLPSLAPSDLRRRPLPHGTRPHRQGAGAAREAIGAEGVWELRRALAAGEFDTPAHAHALAWVLLERGLLRG